MARRGPTTLVGASITSSSPRACATACAAAPSTVSSASPTTHRSPWTSTCDPSHRGYPARAAASAAPVRHPAAGFCFRPAAGADRRCDAGLVDGGRAGSGDARLPVADRHSLHLQIPVGAADRPLRSAAAGPPAWLDRAAAVRAGRRAAADEYALTGAQSGLVRVGGGAGGVSVGDAGRGDRRLPHRSAGTGRAWHGWFTDRAGLSPGDGAVGRHHPDLGRAVAELAAGLPGHGRAVGCRRRAGAAADAAAAGTLQGAGVQGQ
ncbi:hypothetical protein D3C71_1374260 [compost metagenome]